MYILYLFYFCVFQVHPEEEDSSNGRLCWTVVLSLPPSTNPSRRVSAYLASRFPPNCAFVLGESDSIIALWNWHSLHSVISFFLLPVFFLHVELPARSWSGVLSSPGFKFVLLSLFCSFGSSLWVSWTFVVLFIYWVLAVSQLDFRCVISFVFPSYNGLWEGDV